MYEGPIELTSTITTEIDNEIYRAIIKHGVNVDKEELIKALKYDRDQYAKGYNDGLKEFAERLKNEFKTSSAYSTAYIECKIDNLLKEMEAE